MSDFATRLLEKLLQDAEKKRAGVRARTAAITQSALEPYHSNNSFSERESFETLMQAAHESGAIFLTREKGFGLEGRIERVDLLDLTKLALFLDVSTQKELLLKARLMLTPFIQEFKVLNDVLESWQLLKKVRRTSPEKAKDWSDAARVIIHMRNQPDITKGELPIREVSAHLFKNTKVIEKLSGLLDVLLCGNLDSPPRNPREVWSEIGLHKEEQPVRLAGSVTIKRERVCALLDTPYSAFPASTVLGIESYPSAIITIENQTTFHTEAKKCCDENILLIYTAGMPSPAWSAMYTRVIMSVPNSTPILHWGDVDEGGFRIAAYIAKLTHNCGHKLMPYLMAPNDVAQEKRRPATDKTLERMKYYAEAAGWADLAIAISESGFTVEQEALSY